MLTLLFVLGRPVTEGHVATGGGDRKRRFRGSNVTWWSCCWSDTEELDL